MARGKLYRPTAADRETVRRMLLLGAGEKIIAKCIGTEGIAHESLRKHFAEDLRKYRSTMLSEIAQTAYQKAKGGDTGMICFVLKTQAGWREKSEVTLGGTISYVKRVVGVDGARI